MKNTLNKNQENPQNGGGPEICTHINSNFLQSFCSCVIILLTILLYHTSEILSSKILRDNYTLFTGGFSPFLVDFFCSWWILGTFRKSQWLCAFARNRRATWFLQKVRPSINVGAVSWTGFSIHYRWTELWQQVDCHTRGKLREKSAVIVYRTGRENTNP